jgi:hypothetical protein
MGFSREADARRVMEVLPKRFEKYGLTIHPEKTRLVPFERPGADPDGASSEARTPPGTFDLLGFTHSWARSRNGSWVVKRKTSGSRFRRGLKALSGWCRLNRHRPIEDQHRTLSQKLVGHFAYYGITGNSLALGRFAYYGITGNSLALGRFRTAATGIWKRWLSRRRRGGRMPWDRLHRFLERHPLPPAIAVHSVCRPVANA